MREPEDTDDTDDTDDADDTSLPAANINPDWRVESLENSSGERFFDKPREVASLMADRSSTKWSSSKK